jgi:hypothetical protein
VKEDNEMREEKEEIQTTAKCLWAKRKPRRLCPLVEKMLHVSSKSLIMLLG